MSGAEANAGGGLRPRLPDTARSAPPLPACCCVVAALRGSLAACPLASRRSFLGRLSGPMPRSIRLRTWDQLRTQRQRLCS